MILSVLLATTAFGAHPAPKPKSQPQHVEHSSNENLIHSSWYTMQAGSVPYGYFHESVELREGRFYYRYNLVRREGREQYQENVGAIAQEDLTPVTMNLNKAGIGALESINMVYGKDSSGNGRLTVETKGAKVTQNKRYLNKGGILDVFLPMWFSKNWDKLKPRVRGQVYTFAENPSTNEYQQMTTHYEVTGLDTAKNCMRMKIEMEPIRAEWCVAKVGRIEELKMGEILVRRVESEKEAVAFLPKQ